MGWSLPRAWLPAAALLLAALACSCVHSQETAAPELEPAAASVASAVQMESQAGCECLPTWYDAAGIERQGCTNPDNDPMGDWCQVNPNTCLGYYGVYTSATGSDVFYDYCGPVREKTLGGCLCAPDWSMGPGATVGKPHYRDRCARPEAPEAKRKCRVDFATCPENSTVGEFDYCDESDAAAEPQISDGSVTTTYHNCDCKAGWMYTYADGTKGNFSACANPDGDPMGPWCAVDPATCDRFAGEIDGQERNETLGYDYCTTRFRHPEPNTCAAVLKEFDQCGGKSKCSDFGCEDDAWPGACCPQNTRCYRQDSFYYQCLSPYNVQRLKEQQAAAAAAGIAFTGLKLDDSAAAGSASDQIVTEDLAEVADPQQTALADEAVVYEDDQESLLPTPAQDQTQTADSAESDSDGSLIRPGQTGSDSWRSGSEGLPAVTLSPPRQPTKVYTKLKINMDYDKLIESPENTARFKSDVTTWLKSSVGNPQHVQDAGVMAIVRGSVIALAYVEFKPDTPTKEIDLATSHLRTNADRLYSASSLPSSWGGLVSYLVSPNAATLDGATMELVPEHRTKSGKLGTGAIAGIAVALVCAVALSAYIVKRTIGAKRRRELEAHEAAKLGYETHHIDQVKDMDLDGSSAHASSGNGSADGSTYSSRHPADVSTYSSRHPADGSTYSSNDSYGLPSPTKSHSASPTKSAGFGQARAWSDRSKSRSAEEEVSVEDEIEPVSMVVPASAASNISTMAVHGSASASSPQAMAARAATPDAAGAFLPDDCEHTFDDDELDLSKNPVGLLRTMYGKGQGSNSNTGTPGGNRNNGGSYTGSVSSYQSIASRPGSGAGTAGAAVLKQRRISSASKDSAS